MTKAGSGGGTPSATSSGGTLEATGSLDGTGGQVEGVAVGDGSVAGEGSVQALAGPGSYCGTGKTEFNAVRFGYAKNGETVTFVHDEKWCWNPNWSSCSSDPLTSSVTKYAITWAREFRYDGARARYLVRTLDPTAFKNGTVSALDETWTDYDGDEAYGDWAMVNGLPTSTASYEPGLWVSTGLAGSEVREYLHNDHIGTLRNTTATGGGAVEAELRKFTAFGEKIDANAVDRFGYVGEFGYQAHAQFPYLHVGARYYDPSSGRILQRDPIGIEGGINVYAYASSVPSRLIDPLGLWNDAQGGGGDRWGDSIANNSWRRHPSPPRPNPSPPTPRPPSPIPAPIDTFHRVEVTLILVGPGMVGAVVGATVMTLAGVPIWHKGNGGKEISITRSIGIASTVCP